VVPFEEDEVEVIVVLGEDVANDTCWVSIADLIARQHEIDTFGEVPQLGWHVVREKPAQARHYDMHSTAEVATAFTKHPLTFSSISRTLMRRFAPKLH